MKNSLYTLLLLGLTFNVYAADLTVNITNAQVKQGVVKIALYDNVKDFPEGEGRLRGQKLIADKGKLSFTFKELPSGRYAVAVMQDNNNDGVLNRNFFGIPTEPYGFSQRPAGKTGALSFEQAALQIDNENKTINIELVD